MSDALFDLHPLVAPDREPEATIERLGDIEKRFASKVRINRRTNCWTWMAAKDDFGYGRYWVQAAGRAVLAHRFAYEQYVGPIPEGLVIDHLCRNPSCVNPAHLEPVTTKENTLRGVGPSAFHALKEKCPSGHPYDASNTYLYRGMRMCRACRAGRSRRRHESSDATQVRSNPADPRHGKVGTYTSYRCRCDRCRAAWAQYMRARRSRQP